MSIATTGDEIVVIITSGATAGCSFDKLETLESALAFRYVGVGIFSLICFIVSLISPIVDNSSGTIFSNIS